jgi:ribosomal protein L20
MRKEWNTEKARYEYRDRRARSAVLHHLWAHQSRSEVPSVQSALGEA